MASSWSLGAVAFGGGALVLVLVVLLVRWTRRRHEYRRLSSSGAFKVRTIPRAYGCMAPVRMRAVKGSGPGIRIPGENSAKIAAERTKAGKLPIPAKIWESICATAKDGLPK